MRRGLVDLADHADDLGQFFHQVGAVLQPARRVDHQKVRTFGLGLLHRIIGERGRVRTFRRCQHRHAGAIAPDLKLLDRSCAERVARRDHHLLAGGAELRGELADRRGLARAVDADHQHDLRLLGVKRQRFRDRLHDPGDLLGQQPLDLGDRELAAHPPLGEVCRDAQRGVDAHVGGDQQLFEALQHLVIEDAARLGHFRLAAAEDAAQKAGLLRLGAGTLGRGLDVERRLGDLRVLLLDRFGHRRGHVAGRGRCRIGEVNRLAVPRLGFGLRLRLCLGLRRRFGAGLRRGLGGGLCGRRGRGRLRRLRDLVFTDRILGDDILEALLELRGGTRQTRFELFEKRHGSGLSLRST